MNILSDPSTERAVLAIICQNGEKSYLEVADIISENTFTIDSNVMLYKCIKNIFNKNSTSSSIDIALIFSSAQELSLDHILQKKEEIQHLKAIIDFPVNQENLVPFAAKIKKLEITRKLHQQLGNVQSKLLEVTGSEPITQIISIAEDPVLNFSSSLDDSDNSPAQMSDGLQEYIQSLIDNPIKQVGISTGFPAYDFAIGGGLRPSTINVIAARPKTGKTLLSDNMGFNVAKLGIPILNMDTEMTKNDHIHRLLAMMTEIEIGKIETGQFSTTPSLSSKIQQAINDISNMPIYHKSIAGKSFEEQLSIMRRWLIKVVGLNSDGSAKPCVIFYDYLKLMDSAGISQDMKEYQVLGFMMTSLHNFACQYKVPVVAFVQLNRDGITKESTDTASGSDRIIWLCSNFTIFKRKSDEEIAEDGPTNGNRKLLPLVSRHGPGLDDNDYINCHMKGWCAKIIEGKTRLELVNNSTQDNGFDTNDDEDIPFN